VNKKFRQQALEAFWTLTGKQSIVTESGKKRAYGITVDICYGLLKIQY
jgi:hypothetical protein